MNSDAQTAQLIHQRYEDTSLVVFRQAQKKLQRELASKSVASSGISVPGAGAASDVDGTSRHRFSNLFRRGSHSKTTQSAICILL